MSAREEVLARIRGALGEDPSAPPVPRAYRQQGRYAAGSPELVLQLVDRLEDYGATVVRVGAEDDDSIGQAVADALASREIGQAVTPAGTPREWTGWLADVVVDDGSLDGRGLARLPAVLPPPAWTWTRSRDLPTPPQETFTQAWLREHGG